MAQDRTRLIVRKTLEQLRGEVTGTHDSDNVQLQILDKFEARLDFNLDLAGVPKVTGRKPKTKTPKPEVSK